MRKKRKIIVPCNYCGKEKEINPCRFHEGKKFYCGPEHQRLGQKGRKVSEETKRKISATKGGIKTEIRICIAPDCNEKFEVPKWSKKIYHDKKCSSRHIGSQSNPAWNKGLTKESNEVLKARGERHSKWMKDQYSSGDLKIWNKGLTSKNDERMRKLTEHLTKLRNTDGEWKENWRKNMQASQVKAHAAGKYPKKFTKPERLTWAYLESIGCTVKFYYDKSDDDPVGTWYHQYPFEKFVPDFACPDKKAIIEVDGCAYHWHDPLKCQKPEAKYGWSKFAQNIAKRDRRKHWFYHSRGWKWANVWECETKVGDFHRIKRYLGIE